jgi:hypothetical protein
MVPQSRAAQWGLAFLTASVLCCSYPLMFAYRAVRQAQQPQLAARWANDGRFSMLAVFGGEHVQEEVIYAARAREAAEHLLPYDPFINENKSTLMLVADHLTHRVMGLPFLVFKDMDATWMFWRFACAVLWFVLLYQLALLATASPPQALFCAVFVTCFSYLLTLLFMSNLQWGGSPLHALSHNAWTLLSYGRTEGVLRLPRPGFTYLAIFAASLLAVRAAERRGYGPVVVSGLAGGLLAYVRPDVWSMYMGTIGIFTAIRSYQARKIDWRLAASAAVSLLLSLPLLWVILNVDRETALRTGMSTHAAYEYSAWAYLLGCAALLRLKREPVHVFLASMLGFMFLFLHAPLVTGFSVQPDHWKYMANIFYFIGAVSLLPKKWKNAARAWQAATGALLLVALLQGASFAALHYEFFGLPRDIQGGLDTLERQAKLDSVVLSLDPEINSLVPAMTPCKVLISPYNFPLLSDLPLSKNVERVRLALALLGADEGRFVREEILEGRDATRQDYTSARREGAQSLLLRNMAIGYSRDGFAALFTSSLPLLKTSLLEPDYVWIGPFERQYAGGGFLTAHPRWTEIYKSGTVTLYRTKP